MAKSIVFKASGESPAMIEAFERAQDTFKYFWRELSWENRRIVPALGLACVKVAFSQEAEDGGEPIVEHMWINDIFFDGEIISGTLVNEPNDLTNVQNGDFVEIPINEISDWLFATDGKTYGGFTIQAMRKEMSNKERKEHDKAWGLDFGDFDDISVVYKQKEHPENLTEHPMSINMKEKLEEFLAGNPEQITHQDELGYTWLHRETIAGNKTVVEILLRLGADKDAKTANGKSALDFAKELKWEHIIPLLEQ